MIDLSEKDRLLLSAAVISELKQFNKLRQLDPPISAADIAYRMAWTPKDTRWLLRKMKDHRK